MTDTMESGYKYREEPMLEKPSDEVLEEFRAAGWELDTVAPATPGADDETQDVYLVRFKRKSETPGSV
jgi:hypothetical protein